MPVNSFESYPMSWKPVINTKSKPLYLHISQLLEHDIKNGLILPGTKLPPQAELADYLGVNISTVSKAFKKCKLKGLLNTRVGSGTFVSYNALSNTNLLLRPQDNIIEMGPMCPDSLSYEPILAQLKQILSEEEPMRFFEYERPDNFSWQKEAATQYIRLSGFNVDPDNILFVNGGQVALIATLLAICPHGSKIAADSHTIPELKTTAGMLGIQLIPIAQSNGAMDVNALEFACKTDKINGVYLVPDCHNPTAHRMSRERREGLASIVKKYDIFAIEDATLSLMYKKPMKAFATFAPDNTIYIATLSKTIAPFLRFAYLATPQKYKRAVSSALYNTCISVSLLICELVSRIMVSGTLSSIIESRRNIAIERNKLVDSYLAGFKCHGSDTDIIRWLELPDGMTGQDFEMRALRYGVQVYAADRFSIGLGKPKNAARLSISTPNTIDDLMRGLMVLRNILES